MRKGVGATEHRVNRKRLLLWPENQVGGTKAFVDALLGMVKSPAAQCIEVKQTVEHRCS